MTMLLRSFWLIFSALPLAAQDHPGVLGTVLGFDGGEVVVRAVLDGSPARAAGLRVGDRITKIGGNPVRSPVEARTYLYWSKPGTKTILDVKRGKHARSLTATPRDWKTISNLVKWKGAPVKTGGKAAAWWGERWDLPDGMRQPPSPATTRGKVVCLFVYQAL